MKGDSNLEVKFCENNIIDGTEEIINKLKNELSEDEVLIEPCLGYCDNCIISPFALVNDEFVQAETPEELYEKIEDLI